MKNNLFPGIALLLLFTVPAVAQAGHTSVYRFLEIPVSARALALGGNHVSLNGGGVDLFTTNPAYLTEDHHRNLAVSYLNHFSDIYLGTSDFSWHLEGIGTLATGFRVLNYGDFVKVDADGRESGTFSAYDFSWSTAFSRELAPGFRAGAGVQFINSRYDSYRSSAIALFGGLYYTFNDDFTHTGISFQHLGHQLTPFDDTRESLPFTLSASITHRLQHLPLRGNLTLHSLEQWEIPVFDDDDKPGIPENLFRRMRFGLEILFSENVNLRFGYDHLKNEELKTDRRIDLAGATIGLGIVIRDINIDLTHASFSETGGWNQISIALPL